mmetsp:Transcript_45322/g.103235  ORF Transcript_45322/g.103235 Transcript_45322/m.103235 type:complete len:227 (+) Transcript_45322:169-849(+)
MVPRRSQLGISRSPRMIECTCRCRRGVCQPPSKCASAHSSHRVSAFKTSSTPSGVTAWMTPRSTSWCNAASKSLWKLGKQRVYTCRASDVANRPMCARKQTTLASICTCTRSEPSKSPRESLCSRVSPSSRSVRVRVTAIPPSSCRVMCACSTRFVEIVLTSALQISPLSMTSVKYPDTSSGRLSTLSDCSASECMRSLTTFGSSSAFGRYTWVKSTIMVEWDHVS